MFCEQNSKLHNNLIIVIIIIIYKYLFKCFD